MRAWWWLLTCVLACAFAAVAINNAFYELTSPSLLGFHVLLRKTYSLLAFTVLGYCYARARRSAASSEVSALENGLAVGIYSACIEILQSLSGSHEGFAWNAADTAFGVAGGLLSAVLARLRTS